MTSNAGFYIFAIVAIIVAGLLFKHVVTCMMRSVIILVLLAALAVAYYLFIGQYDPEIREAVSGALH